MKRMFTFLLATFTVILSNAQSSLLATANLNNFTQTNLPNTTSWASSRDITGNVTQFSVSFSGAGNSDYLVLTNIGLNIPAKHEIKGIAVSITKDGSGIVDNHIQIVKGGNILNTADYKATGNWKNNPTTSTYGSSADLWNTSWTSADINSSGFGIAIAAAKTNGNNTSIGTITAVSITVYFEAAITLPVHFTGFNAIKTTTGTQLTWKVGAEENVKGYEVEKSTNGSTFSKLAFVVAAGNSSYTFTDAQASLGTVYFRIRNIDNDGKNTYSPVIRFANGKTGVELKAFPTLVTGSSFKLQHDAAVPGAGIIISSLNGSMVKSIIPATNSIQTSVNVAGLHPGMYLVRYVNGNGQPQALKVMIP